MSDANTTIAIPSKKKRMMSGSDDFVSAITNVCMPFEYRPNLSTRKILMRRSTRKTRRSKRREVPVPSAAIRAHSTHDGNTESKSIQFIADLRNAAWLGHTVKRAIRSTEKISTMTRSDQNHQSNGSCSSSGTPCLNSVSAQYMIVESAVQTMMSMIHAWEAGLYEGSSSVCQAISRQLGGALSSISSMSSSPRSSNSRRLLPVGALSLRGEGDATPVLDARGFTP
mmetsp:Transcript_9045/g.23404  ORF Transcript_9045/g.23404 Transcript_9045/m.23404 type:complete len:226 (+) Transcript_9045:1214-1891(+)